MAARATGGAVGVTAGLILDVSRDTSRNALATPDLARALVFETPVAELPALIRRLDLVKAEALARGLPDIAKRASDAGHLCRLRVAEAVPAKQGERTDIAPTGNEVPDTPPATVRQWRSTYKGHTLDSLEERLAESDEPLTRAELSPTNRHAVETGNDERYTPEAIIEAARKVMGCIDLDPASSEVAQRTVKAARYFTKADDGLAQPWAGRVWLNPPYSKGLVDLFVSRFLEADIEAGLILLNNVADTKYGQRVLAECEAVCFTKGRLNFSDGDGVVLPGTGTVGQMIGYRGEVSAFAAAFSTLGNIVVPYRCHV